MDMECIYGFVYGYGIRTNTPMDMANEIKFPNFNILL